MGTCPASSHVKAREVIRSTCSPRVYLEIWTSVPSPHRNHSLCTQRGKRHGHLRFYALSQKCSSGAMLLLESGYLLLPIRWGLWQDLNGMLSHTGCRDLTSFWDRHRPPLKFPRHPSLLHGWVVIGLEWPQQSSPGKYVWGHTRFDNCLQCSEPGKNRRPTIMSP